MRKFIYILLTGFLFGAINSVSYGHTDNSLKKDKYGTEISTIDAITVNNAVDAIVYNDLAVLGYLIVIPEPKPLPLVHPDTKLPKEYSLPTKRLWLLNRQISLK